MRPQISSRRGVSRWAVVGVLLTGAVASSGLAQQAAEPTTLFAMEIVGGKDRLVSPKDAGLVRALGMLPARWRELQEMVPELAEIPQPAVDLALGMLTRPVRVAVTNKGFDPQTGAPGLGVVLSFGMDGEAAARAMHDQVNAVRKLAPLGIEPQASERFAGMSAMPLPFGVIEFGPRRARDGWRYEVIYGAVDDPDIGFAAMPEPGAGMRVVARSRLDFAALSPFTQMLAGMAAMFVPNGAEIVEQIREAGLTGPDAISIDVIEGYEKGRGVGRMTVHGLGRFAEAWGIGRTPISAKDLAAIPADATYAGIKKIDVQFAWNRMAESARDDGEGKFEEILAAIEEQAGIDVETDVVDALGNTAAFYLADSTGGNSLASGVVLIALKDAAQIERTLGVLRERFNALASEMVPPPVKIELVRFMRQGVHYTQLRFPGLPVPLEPTLAVAGEWLVIGATPQAAVAGAEQARAGGAGLLGNTRFKASYHGEGAMSLGFVDTQRTVRDGYPILTFVSSALANAVRSPVDGDREPGLVLPIYGELVDDAKPIVSRSFWSGDDFVAEMVGDESLLVNIAGVLGVGDAVPLVAGALIGGGIGAQMAQMGPKNFPVPFRETPEEVEEGDEDSEGSPY